MAEFQVVRKDVPHVVLLDDEDVDFYRQHAWFISKNGYVFRSGHMVNWVRDAAAYLHRELCGLKKGDPRTVDHINRRRLDNRRANLRVVSPQRNSQNVPAHCDAVSPYRGVSFNSRCGCWVATHMDAGKRWSRHCATELEAAAVAQLHREELGYE